MNLLLLVGDVNTALATLDLPRLARVGCISLDDDLLTVAVTGLGAVASLVAFTLDRVLSAGGLVGRLTGYVKCWRLGRRRLVL